MAKKALLMILDGWGIGNKGKADVIYNTPTPYWDSLIANYPNSQLAENTISVMTRCNASLRSLSRSHGCDQMGRKRCS